MLTLFTENLRFKKYLRLHFVLLVCSMFAHVTQAGELRIAVASNFHSVMKELVMRFQQSTGHRVLVSLGSTGKHYAQISNGAPYDVFFAADKYRPKLLESAGIGISDSRFTYAVGRLVLWSSKPGYVGDKASIIGTEDFRFIAIANPKLAPYGKAAQQVLEKKGLWAKYRSRIVTGENVLQAYKFVESGNAQMGFVAYSQIMNLSGKHKHSYLILDASLYEPIEQQAIMLNRTQESLAFLEYIKSDEAREIIIRYGYDVPG